MKRQPDKGAAINTLHNELALEGPFCLTKSGTLLGGIEISGRDPDGLNEDDLQAMSFISRAFYQNLPESVVSITQYYIHYEGVDIKAKPRDHEVSHFLSQSRKNYLNSKRMNTSRIVHFYEIEPEEKLTGMNSGFLLQCLTAIYDKKSREMVKQRFSDRCAVMVYEESLKRQKQELFDVLEDLSIRYGAIFSHSNVLSAHELWSYMRFFSGFDQWVIETPESYSQTIPADNWDLLLHTGDVRPVQLEGEDLLKFIDSDSVYGRILSVTSFSEDGLSNGVWANQNGSPTKQRGNYVIMSRFCPMDRDKQKRMFRSKKIEIEQKNIEVFDLIMGRQESTEDAGRKLKSAIKKQLEQLERAQLVNDRWGTASAAVLVFDKSPENLNSTTGNLKKSLERAEIKYVIESADLIGAYMSFLPGGAKHTIRQLKMNTSQYAAMSHIYRMSEGQLTVECLGNEEYQYVFYTEDGTPFYYSPYVDDKAIVFGIGPSRSGKSYAKNVMASHVAKYGGYLHAIDIDDGSEGRTRIFGDDGKVFVLGGEDGFNPYSSADGEDDLLFMTHLKNMIIQMLQHNDNEESRRLDLFEQKKLDEGIQDVLRIDAPLRNFGTLIRHLPEELQMKLNRWLPPHGMYSQLMGQKKDALGTLEKKVCSYNLASIKNNPVLLPLAMTEIFYRVTKIFENPDYLGIPKYLDIDEAHVLIKIPYVVNFIVENAARTWAKNQAGIGLWTHNAKECLDLKEWPALRSSISTMFFMAEPNLDEALYMKTFNLTRGECSAIKGLKMQREAYIIQRGIGVSKKVIVDAEPEQHVIVTSKPTERLLRKQCIEQHGFKNGIAAAVKTLKLAN